MQQFDLTIEECDALIDKAGELIDREHPMDAVAELYKIESRHKDLLNSSPYLIAGFNSMMGMAFYHLDRVENPEGNYFLEKAVERFSSFLEIKPNAENVLFMRAKCHDYLDNFRSAKNDYERVIELNPKADCAHSFLGLLMENEGHKERAIELYKAALLLDETDEMSRERLEGLERKGSD